MKEDWLWDRKIKYSEAQCILKDPKDKRFILMASLLLARKHDTKEVFKHHLDPFLFCRHWMSIKRKMREDRWNQSRIIFWQAIYEKLLDRYQKKGVKFRKVKNTVKDELCKVIGKEIRNIRIRQGLSQKELAKKIGISQQLVSRVEKGRENISMLTLKKISKALSKKIEINFIQ